MAQQLIDRNGETVFDDRNAVNFFVDRNGDYLGTLAAGTILAALFTDTDTIQVSAINRPRGYLFKI